MALLNMPTVEDVMKRNPELKRSDLEMLKDWLKKQPHLPQMSDSELALFLHSNYYRIEPTKITIDTFFTVRTHIPEFLLNRDPLGTKEIREMMKVYCCMQLPSSTPEGYKVIYEKLIDSEPSHFHPTHLSKLFSMAAEFWLYTSGTCPGQVIVIDMDGVVFGHIARQNPVIIKKMMYYVQEALPIRLKAIYVVNTPPFTDVLFNIVKPFMNKGLLDILSFHGSIKDLDGKIPIDLLPNDRGGKAGSLEDLWEAHIKELEDHRAWFQEQETRVVNEALRPGKAKSATDLFGVEGTFKKLEID